MRRFFIAAVVVAILGVAAVAPQSAHALGPDGRRLIRMGGYGLAGGTLLGLAQYPFSHNVKNIFVGSSIGLYLGLAVGVFYVANDYETPKAESFGELELPESPKGPYAESAPLMRVDAPLLRF